MSLELRPELTPEHFKGWLEFDYNPFILFGQGGEIHYTNQAAELLLGYVKSKVFYDLALGYAPQDFGYKTTFMNLQFDKFHFFAITVGYEDEEKIGIKIYQNPGVKETTIDRMEHCEDANIYVLVDINISLAKSTSKATFRNEFDPTLPEFKIPPNDFSKVLRKIYEGFVDAKTVTTVIKLKAGEFLYVGERKYQIIELSVGGDSRRAEQDSTIEQLAAAINMGTHFQSDRIALEIPMITS